MDKLRKASKRLSVGSWTPFADGEKRGSRTPSTASIKRSGDFTDGSDRTAAAAALAVPKSRPAAANGVANGAANGVANGAVKAAVTSPTTTTSLVELAKIITRESEKLEKYLKESGSALPSFDIDGPANFPALPDDIKRARDEVMRATKDLEYLVTGPTEKVRWMAWDVSLPDTKQIKGNRS
jgi:hypothetical protein